ncbi:MAG TPA: YtxH domain-containing protein [Gemmatimonadaceae bacterium]|jgi:gas vesicle protein
MSRHHYDEDDAVVVIEKHSAGVGSFLLGIAIGAGVALLFAPHSGAATRRGIKRRAMRVKRSAERAVTDVTESVADTFTDARRRVEDQIDAARDAIDIKKQQVHRAVEAGRAAAHEARAELEQRIAETKAAYNAGAATARTGRTQNATAMLDEDEGV